jgi:uncharacterized protein (DUF302 family)
MKSMLIGIGFAVALITPLAAADNGLVTKQSRYSVAETMDKLDEAIKEAGATVFVRIDLKAAAAKGELLRPHQIVMFGRGGAIQPFLSAASTSGIEFPQKILVFEDEYGKVWMVYNSGKYISHRHGISGLANLEEGIDKTVGGITDKVAQ